MKQGAATAIWGLCMIDFNLLANILNPAIFVILVGGLILGYNTTMLIIIGVVGYGLCFVFHRLGKNQNNDK